MMTVIGLPGWSNCSVAVMNRLEAFGSTKPAPPLYRALVTRGDSVSHQPVGHGHALEHVDMQVDVLLPEERVGGVEAGGARADEGTPVAR